MSIDLNSKQVRAIIADRSDELARVPNSNFAGYRPVIVVARTISMRVHYTGYVRYHTEPVGTAVRIDGHDDAIVAAERTS